MRVKIGDVWYDSTEQPICLQMDEDEKKILTGLITDREEDDLNGKFALFPMDHPFTWEERTEWIKG